MSENVLFADEKITDVLAYDPDEVVDQDDVEQSGGRLDAPASSSSSATPSLAATDKTKIVEELIGKSSSQGPSSSSGGGGKKPAHLDDLITCSYEPLEPWHVVVDDLIENHPYQELRLALRAEFVKQLVRFR
jgi:hypothetical protein